MKTFFLVFFLAALSTQAQELKNDRGPVLADVAECGAGEYWANRPPTTDAKAKQYQAVKGIIASALGKNQACIRDIMKNDFSLAQIDLKNMGFQSFPPGSAACNQRGAVLLSTEGIEIFGAEGNPYDQKEATETSYYSDQKRTKATALATTSSLKACFLLDEPSEKTYACAKAGRSCAKGRVHSSINKGGTDKRTKVAKKNEHIRDSARKHPAKGSSRNNGSGTQ